MVKMIDLKKENKIQKQICLNLDYFYIHDTINKYLEQGYTFVSWLKTDDSTKNTEWIVILNIPDKKDE